MRATSLSISARAASEFAAGAACGVGGGVAACAQALISAKEDQAAVAGKALDEKAPDDLKVATFKALAKSAKQWGNQLDANMTDAVQKVVETSQNPAVRAAAAEAQGALNLPAERAKNLIIQQVQVGK